MTMALCVECKQNPVPAEGWACMDCVSGDTTPVPPPVEKASGHVPTAVKRSASENAKRRAKEAAAAIMLFRWKATKQGSAYWAQVHRQLEEISINGLPNIEAEDTTDGK